MLKIFKKITLISFGPGRLLLEYHIKWQGSKSRSWPIRKRPTGFSQQPFSQPLTQYKSTTDLTYLHRQELATDPTAVKLNRAKQTTRLPKPLAEPPKLFHQLRCLRLATKPAATGSTSWLLKCDNLWYIVYLKWLRMCVDFLHLSTVTATLFYNSNKLPVYHDLYMLPQNGQTIERWKSKEIKLFYLSQTHLITFNFLSLPLLFSC